MELTELQQEVLSFANKVQVAHLATVDNNRPRVRGMQLWFADETGFYFHTGSVKRLPGQIMENRNVEVAFLYINSENPMATKELRVTGEVEIIENKELEKRLFTERPWLNDLTSSEEVNLVLFRIVNSEAYFWDMANNLREASIPRAKFPG